MIICADWVCKLKLYTYTFPSKNKHLILECTVDIISKCFNNNNSLKHACFSMKLSPIARKPQQIARLQGVFTIINIFCSFFAYIHHVFYANRK